ncbi:MAG: hypothetical protein HC879_07235 [Leptolyngbyaceae cyanobacterium SL_5_9]|nr:hypothetical protein [Leptolyngbyaceae cyanobacterium SL_5_9]NJO73189.1 hypothetical protein [Leptolyngbyaceae cyanobacterium RM1_406_9]
MTWAFSLSAECGAEQVAAEQFAQHFDGLSWMLSNGISSQCHTAIAQDFEDNWWCRVCPDNVSSSGIVAPDIAYTMTELGILLYQRLQSAPDFRYALVGVEVDEFRTYTELSTEIPATSFPGLVLAESIWRSFEVSQRELLEASTVFRSFSPGYVWHPYEGEVYRPLTVSLDLKDKLNELLVLV